MHSTVSHCILYGLELLLWVHILGVYELLVFSMFHQTLHSKQFIDNNVGKYLEAFSPFFVLIFDIEELKGTLKIIVFYIQKLDRETKYTKS